jgi:hypothetical protein
VISVLFADRCHQLYCIDAGRGPTHGTTERDHEHIKNGVSPEKKAVVSHTDELSPHPGEESLKKGAGITSPFFLCTYLSL